MNMNELNPEEYLTMGVPLRAADDSRAAERVELQAAYGLERKPDPVLDALAAEAVAHLGFMAAGFNLLDENRDQFFIGLAYRDGQPKEDLSDRFMSRHKGGCKDLVCRTGARGATGLGLDNLNRFAHFNNNPVIEELGVVCYLGAQLIIPELVPEPTLPPLGTFFAIDDAEHDLKQSHVDYAKGMASRGVGHIMIRQCQ